MTFIQNPLIGRASGLAGNVIFYTQFRRNLMRSGVFEYRTPTDPISVQNRAYLPSVSSFCAEHLYPYLNQLMPSQPKSMSKRNFLMSQLRPGRDISQPYASTDFDLVPLIGNGPVNPVEVVNSFFSSGMLFVTHIPALIPQDLIDNHFVFFGVNFTQNQTHISYSQDQAFEATQSPLSLSTWVDSDHMVWFIGLSLLPFYPAVYSTQFVLINTFNF
jgi:hypothetical protein